jgi:hypothetical protein
MQVTGGSASGNLALSLLSLAASESATGVRPLPQQCSHRSQIFHWRDRAGRRVQGAGGRR